ncbi:Similar to CG17119: Cystinosin homolog (Drosophila melanogaster) [Cotesia congregata]|uniref:Similar to CG17119: Cystinosin homolog (Drosophila melanogaster) n=1 Tax=Cotesia congregata TaxID=51543 RepID=A0A8J2MDC5_COTCN|nr:Similar to CG17119: Cystinosin homolog (Drosophila melanogaster) [Cotesia congregata]
MGFQIMKILPLIFFFQVLQYVRADLKVDRQDLRIVVNDSNTFDLYLTNKLLDQISVSLSAKHANILEIKPATFNVSKNDRNTHWNITVIGLSPGYSVISANVTPNVTNFADAFVRVTIERSTIIYYISEVVGWIYFLAWSISFYPQIYTNYKRKSVVGLNFDFLSLNIVGFFLYSLFNCGLYWIPEIEVRNFIIYKTKYIEKNIKNSNLLFQLEYFRRYPKGLNPVQINDIFFAIHAFFATAFTIGQCFFYEVGTQKVSVTARIIHGLFTATIIILIVLGVVGTIKWLDFLYSCSYIKLIITLIKYIPQAFYNFKRKSTVGWSIGNIILDFTGGILSMLQMVLNAYNYDDWKSIFGDPTKFGLGFFSVAFDVLFLLQHYVFYSYIDGQYRI